MRTDQLDATKRMTIYDTHSHIVDSLALDRDRYGDLELEELEEVSYPPALSNVYSCLMATRPIEWSLIARLARTSADMVCPAFGIHPWVVQRHRELFLTHESPIYRLIDSARSCLSACPRAIIGEIGLDQIEKRLYPDSLPSIIPPSITSIFDVPGSIIEAQYLVFSSFWNLASSLHRPISIHCVKSDSLFLDFCRRQSSFPPAFVLHSYTGSDEFIRQLYDLQLPVAIYFSISNAITGRMSKTRLQKLISAIPKDRILIESDESSIDGVLSGLKWCLGVLDQYGISYSQVQENAFSFIGGPSRLE